MNKLPVGVVPPRRVVYGLLGTITISLFGMTSAYALDLKNTPALQVFDQWQSTISSFNTYVSSVLDRKLEPISKSLGSDINAAIDKALGSLLLPDPTLAREEIEKIGNSSNTAINTTEQATNEVDRQITNAVASGTLGKTGQERTSQQVEKTQSSIQQVFERASAAQEEVVTQNVMKQIAQQNTQTAAILGAMRSDGLKLQQSQDLANVNLTNISRSLDGQNQARQRETVGQGFNNLRTAAQARLF